MKNADMPAMPIIDTDESYPLNIERYGNGLITGKFASGLTKREMIAMHALQGLLADPRLNNVEPDAVAGASAKYADALLAELDRTSK